MEAQAAILDHHIAPHAAEQLALGPDAAGLLGQHDQQVERAPADLHRRAMHCQQALARGQGEGAEGDPVAGPVMKERRLRIRHGGVRPVIAIARTEAEPDDGRGMAVFLQRVRVVVLIDLLSKQGC
jgi:hypothetical protein